MNIKVIPFKANEIEDLLGYEHKITKLSVNHLIPKEVYNTLISYLNIENINKKEFLAYIKYVVLILSLEETNTRKFKKAYYDYQTIIENLLNFGIIYQTRSMIRYQNEEGNWETVSAQYKVFSKYLTDEYVIIIDQEEDIKKNNYIKAKIGKNYKKTLKKTDINWQSAIHAEYGKLNNSKIDKEEFIKKFVKKSNAILNFMTNRSINHGHKVNRLYSSFTQLSSVACKYLTIEGQKFHELDIKNAQPLLLYLLLKKNDLPIDDNYIKSVESGNFYEDIKEYAYSRGITKDKIYDGKKNKYFSYHDRDDIKELSYRSIFFYQNYSTKMMKMFKELYPNTLNSLKVIKKKLQGDDTTASVLQNLEYDVIIDETDFESLDDFYFTKHDAVMFTDLSKKDLFYNMLMSSFTKYDINPTIKFKENEVSYNNKPNIKTPSVLEFKTYIKSGKKSSKQKVIDLFNKGYSSREIEEELNINRSTVNRNLIGIR